MITSWIPFPVTMPRSDKLMEHFLFMLIFLMTGDDVFEKEIMGRLRKDFQVGSEDKNGCLFVGQRIQWKQDDKHGWYINVHQNVATDELQEITFDKYLKDNTLTPQMHTAYRSVLGPINWLQTQFHIGYQFSRRASKASSPTIEDVRAINKTVRTIISIPLSMKFWPLRGKTRIVGYPNAAYRNSEDKSSQRAHVTKRSSPGLIELETLIGRL